MNSEDEARFAALYESYHRQVAAYCRRRAHPDEVEDLTADVFLTAWRKIEDAPQGDEALLWLYRIAYLVLTNHWRRSGRQRKLESRLASIGTQVRTSMHDQVLMRQELREVLQAASRLRPRDQEILRLSLWEHLSQDEIGAVLGITLNAAKQRLHRARQALAREHQRAIKRPRQSPAAQKGGEW